ncbi:D-inositol-3-phosphate glycosyltransferase [Dyadobacter sp. CECT 9275]|uniref:D-inositol-3-phosphate glycosyltransferase n=1 Tax=Dyadobacter helix TaxID=2822344 RepID=A0A916J915_9BACT|nr:glycosyltransferase family 4 protein [Dyadobacter sp. CECT 9275]CAG4991415.1 D-inositol-3-phosphate glycosyltransferase [Dyadobacter sp. CECT 9275]
MVLHLSTFHREGGAAVAASRLNRALQNNGIASQMLVHDSDITEDNVTPLAHSKWQKKLALGRFIGERLAFLPFEKDSSVRFAYSPAVVGNDISGHPLVRKADILHLHWINFGFLSLESLKKLLALGKPVVWTLHDMWTFTGGCHYSRGCNNYLTHCCNCPYLSRPGQYDVSFEHFEIKARIYEHANLSLVSPSHWLQQLVQNAALTNQLSALSIPNCIDTDIFRPKDKTGIRNRMNLPRDKKLILFAGANTLDIRKGFLYFREAMQLLQDESYEILIFGKSGSNAFDDLGTRVHYLGKISEVEYMVDAYNTADLIVVPSLEDNLPNTIMEAMACGTPAVGFETGGIGEMIDHKENGYLADFKSSVSLAEGIQWVLKNNEDKDLSLNAREKVLHNYSEKVVADRYTQLYTKLL